jgi:hypothetical protein
MKMRLIFSGRTASGYFVVMSTVDLGDAGDAVDVDRDV